MLTFEKRYIGDVFFKEVNQSLDCHKYEIKKFDRIVGTVFSSDRLSVIILPDITLRIERERRLLKKCHHRMFNNSTGGPVGVVEFSDWQSFSGTRCILRFSDGTVYSFTQNNEHRRLLKPSTWSLFRFDMSNSENFISYFMGPSSGEIECTDYSNLIPVATGIFIIDEKFRLIKESNG
jgi:hypothetical protein